MARVNDNDYLRRLTALRDYQARDLAAQRLDEIEARIAEDRQRRGYQPVTDGDGRVVRWVPTRIEARDIERMQGGR